MHCASSMVRRVSSCVAACGTRARASTALLERSIQVLAQTIQVPLAVIQSIGGWGVDVSLHAANAPAESAIARVCIFL